jgi:hypothetical protein
MKLLIMQLLCSALFARKQSEQLQACLYKCERAREPEKLAKRVSTGLLQDETASRIILYTL